MNSQIKTKEHYVIWYLMIIEMLHINLLPPWNFLCSPCTPSCMHIKKHDCQNWQRYSGLRLR